MLLVSPLNVLASHLLLLSVPLFYGVDGFVVVHFQSYSKRVKKDL